VSNKSEFRVKTVLFKSQMEDVGISSIPYARGSIDITFDISNLPVGKYRLRLSLFDQKKKRVATSVKDFDILPAFY